MAHAHIWSFCGQPGCRDKPWHPNTEDLVSPQLTSKDVAAYFEEERSDPDTYVITPCTSECPNPEPMWLFIRLNDPLMAVIRPNHYRAQWQPDDPHVWAKARSE